MDRNGDVVRALQKDLARKYNIHGPKIKTIWTSFDERQRAKCMTVGAADGIVLKHAKDTSMGNVYLIMPEWNLYNMTKRGPERFLNVLEHRATQSLFKQYCEGVDGGEGDHALIESMRSIGLRHVESFKDCYTLFLDDDTYGDSYQDTSRIKDFHKKLEPAIRAGLCVPQSTGELILQRQLYLLQALNIIVEDILDQGSISRTKKKRPQKPDAGASVALSKLSVQDAPSTISLPAIIASALDQKASLMEYLALLSMEPTVLSHEVNIWFFSRPELLPDERGRRLPVHTDDHISAAFFDAMQNAVRGAATWDYINRLLAILESSAANKTYQALILQELSNTCHLEYVRAQAVFKRYVQSGLGAKWFHRLSGQRNDGSNVRVAMKGDPNTLTRNDPQLHYALRLCQPQMQPPEAVDWLEKLHTLHQSFSTQRDQLTEKEIDSLNNLVVIVGFTRDLTSLFRMPPFSRKKGQMFVSRSNDLDAELSGLKNKVDLGDCVIPIDNLLEPGLSERALETFDDFIVKETGTKLGFCIKT